VGKGHRDVPDHRWYRRDDGHLCGLPLQPPSQGRAGARFSSIASACRHCLEWLPPFARALADGAAVGAFPEGTTWCGLASGRFRPAVFQAAVDTASPVRPVALRYRLAGGGPTTVASFVGPASLWQALVRVAGLQGLVIEVHLLPLVQDSCATRHTLATRAEIAVGCSAAFGGHIGLSVPRTQLRTLPEAVAEMNHALSA
jgi:hypothetical protein